MTEDDFPEMLTFKAYTGWLLGYLSRPDAADKLTELGPTSLELEALRAGLRLVANGFYRPEKEPTNGR